MSSNPIELGRSVFNLIAGHFDLDPTGETTINGTCGTALVAYVRSMTALPTDNTSLSSLLAETREKALEEAARAAYSCPHYVIGGLDTDADGVLLPGSPYDRGRYDAYRAIRSLKTDEVQK